MYIITGHYVREIKICQTPTAADGSAARASVVKLARAAHEIISVSSVKSVPTRALKSTSHQKFNTCSKINGIDTCRLVFAGVPRETQSIEVKDYSLYYTRASVKASIPPFLLHGVVASLIHI